MLVEEIKQQWAGGAEMGQPYLHRILEAGIPFLDMRPQFLEYLHGGSGHFSDFRVYLGVTQVRTVGHAQARNAVIEDIAAIARTVT